MQTPKRHDSKEASKYPLWPQKVSVMKPQDDLIDHYVGALAFFGQAVELIEDEQWETATPCEDWNVRVLVNHVVLAEALVGPLLKRETTSSASSIDADLLGPNPMSAWRGTALQAISAVKTPGALEQVLDLDVGAVEAKQLIGFRISDNVVHSWDIRRAIGADETIPEGLAEYLLHFWLPSALEISKTGMYGKALEPPQGANAGVRLLALLGRDAS